MYNLRLLISTVILLNLTNLVVFGVLLVYLLDLGEIGALDRLFAVLVFLFPAQ